MSSESPSHIKRDESRRKSGMLTSNELKELRDAPVDLYLTPQEEECSYVDEREYVQTLRSASDLKPFPEWSVDPQTRLIQYKMWLDDQPVERLVQYNQWLEKQDGWIRHQMAIMRIQELCDAGIYDDSSEVVKRFLPTERLIGGKRKFAKERAPKGRSKNKLRGRMPRSMKFKDALPERVTVRLGTYFKVVLNNATAPFPYTFGYVNCTDPLISNGGSVTLVPYFAEWKGFFRKYQVNKLTCKAMWGNSETYNVFNCLCAINSQPTFTNSAELLSYFQNEFAHLDVLGGIAGYNTSTTHLKVPVAVVAGLSTDMADTNIVGNTDGSAHPGNNVYLVYATDNGLASVAGSNVGLQIKFNIDFFERQVPQT